MTNIDQKIEAAADRLKQLKALKQKQAAKARHEQAKRERAADTRRKVLIGAMVLEQMQKKGIGPGLMTYEEVRLADWLTRDDDRALFGLPPKAAK